MKFSLEKNKKCEKAKLLPLKNLRLSHKTVARPIGVRAGGGGARGAAAPPDFGQLRFFGQQERIWAKPVFKDVSMFI